jgi:phosphomevalonate kinase
MTFAHAPGKLVLSGAYVVLDGAEAVVAAVDRYAIADTSRQGSRQSPELREAFPDEQDRPPFVDTSSMWTKDRKIGLGSSSAALVAALGAHVFELHGLGGPELRRSVDIDILRDAILHRAYAAHRRAQGGGSGIDVCACTHGGILACTIAATPETAPSTLPLTLPPGLFFHSFRCPESASTPRMLGGVRQLRADDRAAYTTLTGDALVGAARFAAGLRAADAAEALVGLREQTRAMAALADATDAPILPDYLRQLDRERDDPASVVYQAGAGGGDVALFAGREPPSPALLSRAEALGLVSLPLTYGVGGVTPGLPAT